MLTYQEILTAVQHLTPEERVALIEATSQMLREDLHYQEHEAEGRGMGLSQVIPVKKIGLKPIEELFGSLHPDGPALTDGEVDQLRYEYLAEKYGL